MIFQKIKKKVMLQGIPTKHVNLILWLKVNIFLLILCLGSWLVAIKKSTKSKFQHTRKNGINFSLSYNTRVKLGKMPTPLATLTLCVFIFLLPWAKQQERSCVCLSQTSSKGVTLKIKMWCLSGKMPAVAWVDQCCLTQTVRSVFCLAT